ncbi:MULTISPECIES: flagellar brake protein [unclassified Sporolactobacillus]|uniref:flagellar brake protein n=1 Tax=unclassified Sporolactobacillus TaxID=2628533 RepID=UPI002368D851|nr:flagellar brake domain-containing protein [Sporolactobacillus sp. CQH2019]MDD9148643.1 flagellar brake domain-containing protein [Sporolactobacillus sp. CQH2019]
MELKAGATLILEQKERSGQVRRYRCRIMDVAPDAVTIDYPVDEKDDRTPVFMNGTPFTANYVENGGAYCFKTVFLHRVAGKIPMMLLKYGGADSIEKIQRRNFVRVEANLDIAVHSVNGGFRPFSTLTSDIGGGGTLINVPEHHEIHEEDEVDIWLCLPMASGENIYQKLEGKVVRIFTDKKTRTERASIQFKFSGDRERQPIIRFCFEKQLEERKKLIDWEMNHPHG